MTHTPARNLCLAAATLVALFGAGEGEALAQSQPSRAPVEKCAWERVSDDKVGLAAWAQRCDYGFRQIHFAFSDKSLTVIYSDAGSTPDPLVDVLDLLPDETVEAALKRIFDERTDKVFADQCELQPYASKSAAPTGVKRFSFVPSAAYAGKLAAAADPNEVCEPPCGPLGDAPDGIQYFEVHDGARKLLFVRIGQDEPLFDEQTLEILPGK